ncbi:MAG: hypothetical protein HUJ68_10710 [Clostridia bacterium]|nr:hypothetical protein [Clostridia bacterium]
MVVKGIWCLIKLLALITGFVIGMIVINPYVIIATVTFGLISVFYEHKKMNSFY